MAKASDVQFLARVALEGNREQVIQACRCMIANEPSNSSLRIQLQRLLDRTPSVLAGLDLLPKDLKGLVLPVQPVLTLADTELPGAVKSEVGIFLEEQAHADAIHETGLSVPHKLLLSGPPGNGKTSLAGAIAGALNLPLLVVDFSAVVSSHLGETGAKIAKIFRGIVDKPAVLFLDEMETILSERSGYGNSSDVGEAKRIVSTLLMEIDRLPDHVILVGATNHLEMLDRAVIRRFDFHWELPAPDEGMVQRWLRRFAERHPGIPILGGLSGIEFDGLSLSDIEREVKRRCRRWIVTGQSRQTPAPGPEGAQA